ncbi:hypothetical protein [Granulicella sibirica]|nr:hypothetical protein [Granulicella sibirica]
MKKTDPSITYLNSYGYNVVKMPRAGIEVMDLVGRDETTQIIGPISAIWTSTEPAPVPSPPRAMPNVNGQKTDSLDLSLGLDVLAGALQALGASAPSLKLAFHSARSVQFAYTGVTLTTIQTVEAGNYLTEGTLKTDNPVVRNYFFNPDSHAYLITSVLKSASISVSATDANGTDVGIDVPAIQGAVGATIKVAPTNSSNSTLTFTGPDAVTFGFVVQEITRDGDQWNLHGVNPSGKIAFAVGPNAPADAPKPIIFSSPECRIDI